MLPAHLSISRERLKSKENSISHSKSRSKSNEDYSKQTTNEQKRKGHGSISRKSREGGSRSYSKSMEAYSKEKMKMSREKIKSGSGSCDLATARSLSKEKNSSGQKRSSTSAESFANSMEFEIYVQDQVRTKKMKKKSLRHVSVWMLFWIAFLCSTLFLRMRYRSFYEKDEISFDYFFSSVTHHKLAILTDKFDTSNGILNYVIDVGSPINYQREASIYFAYSFVVNWKKSQEQIGKPLKYPLSIQTSLLAWGFDANPRTNDIGPVIAHSKKLTDWSGPNTSFEFGKSLTFSKLGNESMFSKKIDWDYIGIKPNAALRVGYENATFANGSKGISESQQVISTPYFDITNDLMTLAAYEFSTVDPRVDIKQLDSLTSYNLGALRFATSGPKTLGTIAEIAINLALKHLYSRGPFEAKQVDNAIAESLACTLQAVARHPGYFENLTMNIPAIQKDFRQITDFYRTDHLNCLGKVTVKLHTNGVLTSNILFMDNRDGWPTVFHYSVSTNGSVHLESSNGKKSAGLLNVCQVIVMKNGNLWLTAAASGEFYLLEKVVASIVHKIVMNTDPLELLNSETRKRYDARSATVVTGKYYSDDKHHAKEVLQFSEYKILKNKFRSWVETPNRNSDEEQTVASGY